MDTICRKFSAKNTVLVQTVWSLAGESVKHEFLLAAVWFYLLAGLDVVGILLHHPWVASSGEFKMCFDRKSC